MTTRFFSTALGTWADLCAVSDRVVETFGNADDTAPLKRALKRALADEHDAVLAESEHHGAKILRQCRHTVRAGPYRHTMTGSMVHELARLRCGVSVLNADWHRVNPAVPPDCPHCGAPAETAAHFLNGCPRWNDERDAMYNFIMIASERDSVQVPLPWTTLLGGRESTRNATTLWVISTAVQQFLSDTKRLQQRQPWPAHAVSG